MTKFMGERKRNFILGVVLLVVGIFFTVVLIGSSLETRDLIRQGSLPNNEQWYSNFELVSLTTFFVALGLGETITGLFWDKLPKDITGIGRRTSLYIWLVFLAWLSITIATMWLTWYFTRP